jgi:archaellum component FlaF (FlaF/FlaG flagellin family)
MALTKQTVTDKIEVLENGTLQVRSATRVLEDGEVLSSSFHRHVLAPGEDTSNEDAKVVSIATATWTPEVIAAYEAMLAAQEAEMNPAE